jgi:hypothetical protein
LEFSERPEYELYVILFENILRKLNFDFCKNESKNNYIKVKLNQFLNIGKGKKNILNNKNKIKNLFSGYPLSYENL